MLKYFIPYDDELKYKHSVELLKSSNEYITINYCDEKQFKRGTRNPKTLCCPHFDADPNLYYAGLIYLNMAPLHHDPFDHLLFFLGKNMIYKELQKNNVEFYND